HAFDVVRHDLCGHRAAVDAADLLEDLLVGHALDLAEQGRVGGDAVQDAPAVDGTDLVDVGGIEEELHRGLPVGSVAIVGADSNLLARETPERYASLRSSR